MHIGGLPIPLFSDGEDEGSGDGDASLESEVRNFIRENKRFEIPQVLLLAWEISLHAAIPNM